MRVINSDFAAFHHPPDYLFYFAPCPFLILVDIPCSFPDIVVVCYTEQVDIFLICLTTFLKRLTPHFSIRHTAPFRRHQEAEPPPYSCEIPP